MNANAEEQDYRTTCPCVTGMLKISMDATDADLVGWVEQLPSMQAALGLILSPP